MHGNLCLSKTNISRKQTIHSHGFAHVSANVFDGLPLIRRVNMPKCFHKFLFLLRKWKKRKPCRELSVGVIFQEIFGYVFDLFLGFGERLLPFKLAELGQCWLSLSDVFADAVDLFHRDKELIISGVVDLQVFTNHT